MKDTEAALKWIVDILHAHKVPFQIVGGFAARLYGSDRELADIDIDIPEYGFDTILSDVRTHIISGPEHYKDEHWDLNLMTLSYKGQVIDISGEARIFDITTKEWIRDEIDFSTPQLMPVYGIMVPVIPKERLIAYKQKLQRDVDKADIAMLMDIQAENS